MISVQHFRGGELRASLGKDTALFVLCRNDHNRPIASWRIPHDSIPEFADAVARAARELGAMVTPAGIAGERPHITAASGISATPADAPIPGTFTRLPRRRKDPTAKVSTKNVSKI